MFKVIVALLLVPILAQAFVLYNWNLKHLGREDFDYDRVASILGDADLVMLQEVNKSYSGKQALLKLRNGLKKVGSKNQHICMGLSKVPSEALERYAMLWNEDVLVQIDEKGRDVPCKLDETVELDLTKLHEEIIVREPAYILLRDRISNRIFMAATEHAVPKPKSKTKKSPKDEIPLIFESVDAEFDRLRNVNKNLQVIILGGDFNLSVTTKAFNKAEELGFKPLFPSGPKTSLPKKAKLDENGNEIRELASSYDNIFFKNITKPKRIVRARPARVVNLLTEFDLSVATLNKRISDHCPLRTSVNMNVTE